MNNNIDEVHASSLEFSTGIWVHKKVYKFLKSMLLSILSLEVVHSFHDFDMTTFHQADSSQEFDHCNTGSTQQDVNLKVKYVRTTVA